MIVTTTMSVVFVAIVCAVAYLVGYVRGSIAATKDDKQMISSQLYYSGKQISARLAIIEQFHKEMKAIAEKYKPKE